MINNFKINQINSIGLFKKKSILLKIFFYKKRGCGKIFFKNILDKFFIKSIKDVIFLLKLKFKKKYKILSFYDIFFIIKPYNCFISGVSINLAFFLIFFCLIENLILSKKLIIIGNINKYGHINHVDYINKKISNIKYINNILIMPKNKYENLKKIKFDFFFNSYIIEVKNLNELIKLFNINI